MIFCSPRTALPGWRSLAALAVVLVLGVHGAEAQPVVLSLASDLEPVASSHDFRDEAGRAVQPEGVRARFEAEVLRDAVEAAGRGLPAEIVVEVAPGVTVRSRALWAERRSSGGLTWSGSVEGDALGHILLTVENGAVVGVVSVSGRSFAVRYAGAGQQVIYEVGAEGGDSCGTKATPEPEGRTLPERAGGSSLEGLFPQSGGSRIDTINVLALYTDGTRMALGDELEAFLQSLLDTTNDHFIRSEALGRIAFVDTREVAAPEVESSVQMLALLTGNEDGVLDEVHGWRAEVAADLVTLLFEQGSWCGVAHIPSSGAGEKRRGFNVVRSDCVHTVRNFTHEIGHNLGLRHDRFVDAHTTPYAYGLGYVETEGTQPFRTVMAYTDACTAAEVECPAVPYFAAPALTFAGQPLGEAGRADAVRALYWMLPTVANYYRVPTFVAPMVAPDIDTLGVEEESVRFTIPPQGPGTGPAVFGTSSESPRHGRLLGIGTSALIYRPYPNFFGADSFTYRVESLYYPLASWSEGVIRVEMQPVNDAPRTPSVLSPRGQVTLPQEPGTLSIEWSVVDPDGDPVEVTWTLLDASGHGTPVSLEIPAGVSNTLEVSTVVLDSLMAEGGVELGEWRGYRHQVHASDGEFSVASSEVDLWLKRPGIEYQSPGESPGGLSIPDTPVLREAYPNPAQDGFTLTIGVPRRTSVQVTFYDALGREVKKRQSVLDAGYTELPMQTGTLPAGAYVYRIRFDASRTILRGRVVVL